MLEVSSSCLQYKLNGWRTGPMYSFAEAAHLADVSAATVRNWLKGYVTRDRQAEPLFNAPEDQGSGVSFLQLIEIMVAGRLRKAERASYRKVYEAYRNARGRYDFAYPFAHMELKQLEVTSFIIFAAPLRPRAYRL